MSRSRRSSGRNRNGNRNGGGGGGSDNSRDFWGTTLPSAEPAADALVDASDPTAMVRSLATPPLAGNRPISEHYFTAVYGKAAGLAHALLAAEQDTTEPETADSTR